MATRFWLTSSAAPYTPTTVKGSWAVASGFDNQYLGRKPAGSAGTSSINVGSTAANRDVLLHRSVSDGAVKAGTLTGTVNWVIGVKESNAALNGFWHVHIYVTAGSTDTARGTLLSNSIGATEFGTTAVGASEGAQTVSSVSVQVGDRIVCEIGYRASSGSTLYNATINYGNTGTTDLAVAGSTPTLNPGWIEFSGADGLWTNSLSGLADDFASGSFGAQWTASAGTSVTGGRARINCTTVSPNVKSAGLYELQASALAAQVPTVPVTGGGSSVACSLYVMPGPSVSTTNLEVGYNASTGNMEFRSNVGGSDASLVTVAYDATAHAYWRVRESGGSITMDTSPDNSTWTTRRTISSLDQWMRTGALMAYLEASRASGIADFAEFDNVNQAASHTIAVGIASETGTGQALGKTKTLPAGIASATAAAQPVARAKRLAIGVATETDAGQAAGRSKTLAASTASATGTAQPAAARKTRVLGPAAETDAGRPFGHPQPLTPAGETAAAQPLAGSKTLALGTASETATAQTIPAGHRLTLGIAGEQATAQPAAQSKTAAVGTAAETATASLLGRARSLTPAGSTGTARPLAAAKTLPLGVASEVSEAQALVGSTAHAVAPAVETGTARPLGVVKRLALGPAVETSAGQALAAGKRAGVQPATSTGTAQSVAPSKTLVLGTAAETATARPVTTPGHTTLPLTPAAETGTAQTLAAAKAALVGPASASDAAQALQPAKRLTLSPAFEYGTSQPAGRAKAAATGYATETATAQPLTASTGRSLPLGTATETATAYGPGLAKRKLIGTSGETATALSLTSSAASQTIGLRITGRPSTPWSAGHAPATAWSPGAAHTPWSAGQAATPWSCRISNGGDVNSLSTEYHEVPVTWTGGDPTAYTVQMAVIAVGHEPATADWHTAAWDTNTDGDTVAKLLVGPDGGAVDPGPGRFRDWVDVDASPEHPILMTPPYDID